MYVKRTVGYHKLKDAITEAFLHENFRRYEPTIGDVKLMGILIYNYLSDEGMSIKRENDTEVRKVHAATVED
jgi:hypothetical protein